MEPLVAAEAAETAVEGTVGAAIAVARPTLPIAARWHRIPADPLPRASHSLSVVRGRAYLFGGQGPSRELADSTMHVLTLPSGSASADYRTVPAAKPDYPPPRLGHAAAVVGHHIYVFGGRAGSDGQPLDEKGRVWVFDTVGNAWSHLDPAAGSPVPAARAAHACAASEHPAPTAAPAMPDTPASADAAAAAQRFDGYGTLFVHGGRAAAGRLADAWSFDVAARFWAKLPDAPGAPREGAALAVAGDRLYRYGGADGTGALGGGIDYLALQKATFDDKGGKGELALALRSGNWETVAIAAGSADDPGARAAAGLHPVTTGQGRRYLVLALGERAPATGSEEERAVRRLAGDVWAYQLRPEGMSGASFKDVARMVVGAPLGEGRWAPVGIPEASMGEGNVEGPGARAGFASSVASDLAPGVVVWGGVDAAGERLGDGWMLTFDD